MALARRPVTDCMQHGAPGNRRTRRALRPSHLSTLFYVLAARLARTVSGAKIGAGCGLPIWTNALTIAGRLPSTSLPTSVASLPTRRDAFQLKGLPTALRLTSIRDMHALLAVPRPTGAAAQATTGSAAAATVPLALAA